MTLPALIPLKSPAFTDKFCQVLGCDADIVGLGGGKGGSKTFGVVLDTMNNCLAVAGLRVAYVRRDWSHSEEVRDEIKKMINDYFTNYDDSGNVLKAFAELVGDEVRFLNGSKIVLLNCHDWASAEKFHGRSFDIYIWDEYGQYPPGLVDFARLGKRVKTEMGIRSREWMISNPQGDNIGEFIDKFHIDGTVCCHPNAAQIGTDLWRWTETIEMPEELGGGTEELVYCYQHSTYLDNPFIDRKQYFVTAFSPITDEKLREKMMKGNFNALTGAVLRGFNKELHVYDPDDEKEYISDAAEFIGGGDWGDNAPAVLLPAVLDVNHEIRIFGELYDVFDTSEDFAIAAQKRYVRDFTGLYTWLTWLDIPYAMDTQIFSAGKGWAKGVSTGSRLRDDFGFTFVPTNKSIKDAIQAIRDLFAINPATGRPYLRISKNCPNLIKDIPRWTYDEVGKPGKGSDLHALAALRYLVTSHKMRSFPKVTRRNRPHDTLRRQLEEIPYSKEESFVPQVAQEDIPVLDTMYRGNRTIAPYDGD